MSAYCAEQLLEAITTNDDFRGTAADGGGEMALPSLENVKTGACVRVGMRAVRTLLSMISSSTVLNQNNLRECQ